MADATYRKTMTMAHGVGYYRTEHRITVSKVMAYLTENPTLDTTKAPLSWDGGSPYGPCTRGIETSEYSTSSGRADYNKRNELSKEQHAVSFTVLRDFIMQHPQLKLLYENKKPVTKTKTIREIVERPLALTDREHLEMFECLQRQQHIRNEYVRRAYLALERAIGTKDETTYRKNLDGELAAMQVLRTLMERLEVPTDDWMNSERALVELSVIEQKEVTHDLHLSVSRSDGGGGLASGPNRATRKGSRTRKAESGSAVVC